MNKKLTIALAAVVGISGLAAVAQTDPNTQPGPPPQRMMGPACPTSALMVPPPMFTERAPSILQLSEAQRIQLKDILTKAQESLKPLRESASKASGELRDAVMAPESDAAKVQSLKETAMKSEADVLNMEIGIWTKFKAVLNAEQLMMYTNLFRPTPRQSPPPVGGTPGQQSPGITGKVDPNSQPVPVEPPPPAPGQ